PAELALDFLDELADLSGGGFRLLPLDADERGLVLLIIEENVENAVGQQCEADDRDEQPDILGEQAPASPCSGNFGARAWLRAGHSSRRPAPDENALEVIANRHPGHSIRPRRNCVMHTACLLTRSLCWHGRAALAKLETERLRSPQVDDQIENGGLLDRE